jgi:hypothetical protein
MLPMQASAIGQLQVDHTGAKCMVADQFPQVFAGIIPLEKVAKVRVYFKAAIGTAFYYVEMTRDGAQWLGRLPKPSLKASPITYYVEAYGPGFDVARSAEFTAVVHGNSCPSGEIAAPISSTSAPVTVYSLSGATAAPTGFGGVAGVMAGTSIATGSLGTALGAGMTGGAFGVGTTTLAGVGLFVAGAGVAVAGAGEGGNASPSR